MTKKEKSSADYSMQGNVYPVEELLEVSNMKESFVIGIPKELKDDENRVSLTPEAVELLVANGHKVIIEKDAGKEASYSNQDYSNTGGKITDTRQDIYKCDIILKVAPLTDDEIGYLKKNQIIISSLRLPSQSEGSVKKMMEKKVTCIAHEFLKDENNTFPVVRSMSEISGMTSIMIASEYLSNVHKGKGVLVGGIAGITPTEVTILGAGTAGEFAARAAKGLGASIKIFDDSIVKLREIKISLGIETFTSTYHPQILYKTFRSSDIIIGAMDIISKNKRPFYVTEEMIKIMKPGSVIIDLSIDQGGCFETSKFTTHKNPVFVKNEVIHYCVPNIPSRVSRTASIALSNIFTPILLSLGATGGIKNELKDNFGLRHGVYIYNGILTNKIIGNKFNIRSQDIDLLMAVF